MSYAIDFSEARPSVADLKAANAAGILRYICEPANAKCINVGEARRYVLAEVPFALVYEDGALDFFGTEAGIAKASIAAPTLSALVSSAVFGAQRPVYCAFDGDVSPAQYAAGWAAMHAFSSALHRPEACYGPRPFLYWLECEHSVKYLWESGAASWNTGVEPKGKTIQQLVARPPGCGALSGVDWDELFAEDWGQFPAPPKPHPAPKPQPAPAPTQVGDTVNIHTVPVRIPSGHREGHALVAADPAKSFGNGQFDGGGAPSAESRLVANAGKVEVIATLSAPAQKDEVVHIRFAEAS